MRWRGEWPAWARWCRVAIILFFQFGAFMTIVHVVLDGESLIDSAGEAISEAAFFSAAMTLFLAAYFCYQKIRRQGESHGSTEGESTQE